MSDDPRTVDEPRGPGRPRRTEDWSQISFELPARVHDAIVKASELQTESVAEWVRGACESRLRRERVEFSKVKKPGEDDLLVG